MLSIQKVSLQNANYYLSLAREDYYLQGGEPPGQWHGQGAQALGLHGEVQPDAFRHLFAGFSPDGQQPLVQNAGQRAGYHQRCPGWDLTFSAPKSVSVCWALAPGEVRQAIAAAHHRAVQTALTRMEELAGITRRGHGGKLREQASFCYALFEHGTSRAQDPQLHTHAICFNLAVRSDGTTGAVRSNSLFEFKMAIGALYRSELANALHHELGFPIQRVNTWFEIAGVNPDLADQFSTRRQEILQFCEERGTYGALEAQTAALATRETKEHVAREALFAHWQERGAQLGWGQSEVSALRQSNHTHEQSKVIADLRSDVAEAMEQGRQRSSQARPAQERSTSTHTADQKRETQQAVEQRRDAAKSPLHGRNKPQGQTVSHSSPASEPRRDESRRRSAQAAHSPGQPDRVSTDRQSGSLRRSPARTPHSENRSAARATPGHPQPKDGRIKKSPFAVVRIRERLPRWGAVRFQVHLRFFSVTVQNRLIAQRAPRWSPLYRRTLPVVVVRANPDPFGLKARITVALERTRRAAACQLGRMVRSAFKAGARLVFLDDQRLQSVRRIFGPERAGLDAGKATCRPQLMLAENAKSVWRALQDDWRGRGIERPDQKVILTQTEATADKLNREAQRSRRQAGRIHRNGVWIHGTSVHANDRLLFLAGHTTPGIEPGDLGTVVKVSRAGLTVDLDDGRQVKTAIPGCPALKLAYALTHDEARNLRPKAVSVLFEANDSPTEARAIIERSSTARVRVFAEAAQLESVSYHLSDQLQQRDAEWARSQNESQRSQEERRRRHRESHHQSQQQSQ
ncbi:MAG: MobF family relaxase [Limisphaerales bacterium]